jgi:hypothetical protein
MVLLGQMTAAFLSVPNTIVTRGCSGVCCSTAWNSKPRASFDEATTVRISLWVIVCDLGRCPLEARALSDSVSPLVPE